MAITSSKWRSPVQSGESPVQKYIIIPWPLMGTVTVLVEQEIKWSRSRNILFLSRGFMAFTVSISEIKHFENASFVRVGEQQENVPENKLFTSVSWSKKTIDEHVFFTLTIISISNSVWNRLEMRLSCARENYRKTFRKTSYTLAFPSNGKTIDEHHIFMEFNVRNSVGKTLGKCSVCALGKNYRKTVQEKQAMH